MFNLKSALADANVEVKNTKCLQAVLSVWLLWDDVDVE